MMYYSGYNFLCILHSEYVEVYKRLSKLYNKSIVILDRYLSDLKDKEEDEEIIKKVHTKRAIVKKEYKHVVELMENTLGHSESVLSGVISNKAMLHTITEFIEKVDNFYYKYKLVVKDAFDEVDKIMDNTTRIKKRIKRAETYL